MPKRSRKAGVSRRPAAKAPKAQAPTTTKRPKAKQPEAKPPKPAPTDAAPTKPTSPTPARAKPKAKRNRRRGPWPAAYLASLAATGHKGQACRAARIDRKTVWEYRAKDEAFATLEREAEKQATEILKDEAVRRAVDGVTRVRIDGKTGKVVSREIVYSDMLLVKLLIHQETGSWRDRQVIEQAKPDELLSMTRAERLARLDAAEAAAAKPL